MPTALFSYLGTKLYQTGSFIRVIFEYIKITFVIYEGEKAKLIRAATLREKILKISLCYRRDFGACQRYVHNFS